MLPLEISTLLTPPPEGQFLVITVGNTLRGDDGVGPFLAELVRRPHPGIAVIDVGEHPEKALDVAERMAPGRIVIVDAADFGGAPGAVRRLSAEDFHHATLSTHRFPLAVIARMLADDTGAEVFFLGVQAKDVTLGGGLSPEVRRTAEALAGVLEES